MLKVFTTVRTHWKKSIFFTGCLLYGSKYARKWQREDQLMRKYCLKARDVGRQTITAAERPRKVIVFLNPAAKDGKTKYLLEKHVLPLLHLAGMEIHVVRTEHEGQAKAYMGVLDKSIVDAVVIAGGDGTLSEIVTGLLRREDGIAQRIPIGVLPFGNTNSFASRIFPPGELEVERYCQASMAIIGNKYMLADVMEIQPTSAPQSPAAAAPPDSAADESKPEDPADDDAGSGEGNKNVYMMSHLKWGIHPEIEHRKWKYWYLPGPLKNYYCYLKTVLFSDWPPHVTASLQFSPACEGCSNCLVAPAAEVSSPKPAKSVWWWPTDNRKKSSPPAAKPDPRLGIVNPECGSVHKKEISSPELRLTALDHTNEAGHRCSLMELRLNPEVTKTEFLSTNSAPDLTCCERLSVSSVTLSPGVTEPWYVIDSERFEVMSAKITLLKNKIKVFTL